MTSTVLIVNSGDSALQRYGNHGVLQPCYEGGVASTTIMITTSNCVGVEFMNRDFTGIGAGQHALWMKANNGVE